MSAIPTPCSTTSAGQIPGSHVRPAIGVRTSFSDTVCRPHQRPRRRKLRDAGMLCTGAHAISPRSRWLSRVVASAAGTGRLALSEARGANASSSLARSRCMPCSYEAVAIAPSGRSPSVPVIHHADTFASELELQQTRD
ncbi:hypothetical protein NUW54_g2307 [Trametes sanguinea]|uniref:Uncharacterized protein n=1 Tax=Trametes sanguinea TaxID=158606 RepID=A0ACC1Q6K1_9APHY|nr:hypothetical protein NUW54_g2307 [Trametes sanguinea]